jgi:hypothetical protein
METNLPADATEMRPESARVRRRKTRLRTISEIDARTVAGRRARDLAALFEAELGQVTPAQRIAIASAAALVAISEDAAARRLAGDVSVALDDVVRAAAMARRAVRDLGLERRAREARGPTLEEYLAAKRAGTDGEAA